MPPVCPCPTCGRGIFSIWKANATPHPVLRLDTHIVITVRCVCLYNDFCFFWGLSTEPRDARDPPWQTVVSLRRQRHGIISTIISSKVRPSSTWPRLFGRFFRPVSTGQWTVYSTCSDLSGRRCCPADVAVHKNRTDGIGHLQSAPSCKVRLLLP